MSLDTLETVGCMLPATVGRKLIDLAHSEGIGRSEWIRRTILAAMEGVPRRAIVTSHIEAKPRPSRPSLKRGREEVRYEHDGMSMTLTEWADLYKVDKSSLYNRLYQGMPIGRAIEKTLAWEAKHYPGGRSRLSDAS